MVEPAVAVAVLVGVRPGAEFFHVVAHGGHSARMIARGPAKERDGILDAAEREQVAEFLQAGNHLHRVAAFVGDVIAEQFRNLAPRRKKMAVVDQRVFHSRFGQRRGQLRLPHAFGKPCAGGPLPKMLFDKMAQAPDLLDSIFVAESRSESARKIRRRRSPPGRAPPARQCAGYIRDAFRPAIRAASRYSAAPNGRAGGAPRIPQTASRNARRCVPLRRQNSRRVGARE